MLRMALYNCCLPKLGHCHGAQMRLCKLSYSGARLLLHLCQLLRVIGKVLLLLEDSLFQHLVELIHQPNGHAPLPQAMHARVRTLDRLAQLLACLRKGVRRKDAVRPNDCCQLERVFFEIIPMNALAHLLHVLRIKRRHVENVHPKDGAHNERPPIGLLFVFPAL